MQAWQLQHAKNRLSELVDRAARDGPQLITRRGIETAVVLSVDDFRKLSRPANSLVEFLRSSPLAEVQLDLERDPDSGRDVAL